MLKSLFSGHGTGRPQVSTELEMGTGTMVQDCGLAGQLKISHIHFHVTA